MNRRIAAALTGLGVAGSVVAGSLVAGSAVYVGYLNFFWRAVPLYLIPL